MTWVKLCGLRTRADVEVAVEAGADAVGFVIAPRSPRRISLDEAADIGSGVDVTKFLVTVGLEPSELVEAAAAAKVDGVQPHGVHALEAATAAQGAGYQVLLPIGRGRFDDVPGSMIPLMDSVVPGEDGGTGVAFDWSSVEDPGRPWVLAGGLTPANVAEAIAVASPWGVDVSSGIERERGTKDHDLMHRFVEAIR